MSSSERRRNAGSPHDGERSEGTVRAGRHQASRRHSRRDVGAAEGGLGQRVLREEPPPPRLRQRPQGALDHGQGGGRQLARCVRGGGHHARHRRHHRGPRAEAPRDREAVALPRDHRRQRPGHRAQAGGEHLRPAALRLEVPSSEDVARPAGNRHLRGGHERPHHDRPPDAHLHEAERQAASAPHRAGDEHKDEPRRGHPRQGDEGLPARAAAHAVGGHQAALAGRRVPFARSLCDRHERLDRARGQVPEGPRLGRRVPRADRDREPARADRVRAAVARRAGGGRRPSARYERSGRRGRQVQGLEAGCARADDRDRRRDGVPARRDGASA